MPETSNIIGLKEFQNALRAMDPRWGAALSLAHQKIGSQGAAFSRARARSMGGVWARSASAIGEQHNERQASVRVFPTRADKMAGAAFWGALRHTGWYANPRYSTSPPQHPPWVDKHWEVAVATEGPYAINPALAAHKEDLLDEYLIALDRIAKAAFPEGG